MKKLYANSSIILFRSTALLTGDTPTACCQRVRVMRSIMYLKPALAQRNANIQAFVTLAKYIQVKTGKK